MSTTDDRRNVLVTHADEPLGRRLVKALYHDFRVGQILAVGRTRPPRTFDRFLRDPDGRVHYARVDLTKHRPVTDLFHSRELRKAQIDTVAHLPRHAQPNSDELPSLAGLADRTAEARLVLQHCLEVSSIRHLVAVGSAFVYRLSPGNANRFTETSELELSPNTPSETRSWIDCDMIFHGEVNNDRLRVALLRVPTVIASGGFVFLNPTFGESAAAGIRPMGFDPLCALVSDKDVTRAVRLAIRSDVSGIFNIAGQEAVPISMLARWAGKQLLPVPGQILRSTAWIAHLSGAERALGSLDGDHLRYGFTLDTSRAERELGFRPEYRIGLSRSGDGAFRIETARA